MTQENYFPCYVPSVVSSLKFLKRRRESIALKKNSKICLYYWIVLLEKPDTIILAADHQEIVEEVDDRADYQEDDPEPEEDKYFLNDDVGC